MKKTFTALALLLTGLNGFAQVDSLRNLLRTPLPPAERSAVYRQVIRMYSRAAPDSAIAYGHRGLAEFTASSFQPGILAMSAAIGETYRVTNRLDSAMLYLEEAVRLAKLTGDSLTIAQRINSVAVVHSMRGDYVQALERYLETLRIGEALGSEEVVAYVGGNIAYIYCVRDEYDQAFAYMERTLTAFRRLEAPAQLASAYHNFGNLLKDMGRHEEALAYLGESLSIREGRTDMFGVMACHVAIGLTMLHQERLDSAAYHLEQGLMLSQQAGDRSYEARSLNGLAKTALSKGRYQQALGYAERAETASTGLGMAELESQIASTLYQCYANTGQYKEAFRYQYRHHELADSLRNDEKTREIARLESEYAFAQEREALENERALLEKDAQLRTAQLQRTRSYILAAIAAALLLAVAAFSFYRQARLRSKANRLLRQQKSQIEEKNEELNQLNEEINTQNEKLDFEYQRSEGLLLNILPSAVASELKQSGKAVPRHYDRVSILFADFVGFTKTAERLTTEELVGQLNEIFTAFDRIMKKHGVEKIKTIGDAYMAAAGLPEESEGHAEKAVNAALEMQAFIGQYSDEHDRLWQMRVGVHSGPVSAGVVGESKFAYDVWGDTVNLAARMEQHGEAGKVNVSEATARLVSDRFGCTFRSTVEAKNKGEVAMYFVGSKNS